MTPSDSPSAKNAPISIAILGGGISGLAAAHRLREQKPDAKITIFEATQRCGGVIRSERAEGFLIEQSADSFLFNEQMPWAGELAKAIGMEDALIAPYEAHRRALIVKGKETLPVPEGFYLMAAGDLTETWKSPILSLAGKWRLWAERWIPKAKAPASQEESLTEFATRRVGRETFERLVQPLVSGIYSADPDRLSVAAALPQFIEMEQKHGSLTAGLKHQGAHTQRTAGARYQMFRTPREGLQSLVERLAQNLDASDQVTFRFNERVNRVGQRSESAAKEATQNRWCITTDSGEFEFDALISALPAPIAANVFRETVPTFADAIGAIEHVGVAVACLGYRREQIKHPLDAFGIVVPSLEKRDSIALSFSSNKFPDRAPENHVLLRVFLGGALRPDLVELDDAELITRAAKEAAAILGIDGEPVITRLNRWRQITPQYHRGHADRIAIIESQAAELPCFAVAGNALRGVGIPQCVRSGQVAAERVAAEWSSSPAGQDE